MKITCSAIETPPTDWGLWRRVIDRNGYINFKYNFPNNAYFCNSVLDFEKIKILGRIGSESADGEVYRIIFKETNFALKIMPRIDNDSELKNLNEIQTAISASKYKEFFPMTFAFGYCPDSSYYNNKISGFIPKAIEYNLISKCREQIDKKKKRFDADYKNGMKISDLKNKYGLQVENVKNIQCDFLISELANGDLGTWMLKIHSNEEWKKILLDIITGTYYLTAILGKVHPDLHPGNVLIIKGKEIKALIHDFGRCYDVTDESCKSTLLSFCSEFISCSNSRDDLIIPREILIIIQSIYVTIKKLDINIDNIKEVYENVISKFLE